MDQATLALLFFATAIKAALPGSCAMRGLIRGTIP